MEDLGKSIPVAESMVDAEQSAKSKHPNEFCLNCGTRLTDTFCQHCGQKDIPRRQTLGELWMNFISSFWSYEGKFFLTTRYLITKPGFLATEYNAGRRESYYHPARMYAFISFIFFLIFFSVTTEDSNIVQIKTDGTTEEDSLGRKKLDSILTAIPYGDSTYTKVGSKAWVDSLKKATKKKKERKNKFNFGDSDFTSVKSYDSAQLTLSEEKRDGWLRRRIVIRGIELNDKYGDDYTSFGKEFGKIFMDNFSKVLFFLLPVFALILKLLYIRRDYFYSEHLVFSIYYYNFLYLAGSFQMLIGQVSWLEWASTLIGFWIFFYLVFAMKRMYRQSWGKTIFKYIIFGFVFLIFALIGVSFAGLMVLMLM